MRKPGLLQGDRNFIIAQFLLLFDLKEAFENGRELSAEQDQFIIDLYATLKEVSGQLWSSMKCNYTNPYQGWKETLVEALDVVRTLQGTVD